MFLLGISTVCYIFLILILFVGFKKVREQEGEYSEPSISFSIVVPYRNEAENLPLLLKSLAGITYPRELFQVILIDDASEDVSPEICYEFQRAHPQLDVQLMSSLQSSGAPKKDAIKKAVEMAKHPYILTTDADCEVPKVWLKEMDRAVRETKAEMISGPVMLKKGKTGLLQRFQEVDFLSLQASTMGGFGIGKPFLCNAANLCFRKKSFFELGGYQGNEDIASGDDIFLMEKFIAADFKAVFLKNKGAIVATKAQADFTSLISQRIRWASKSTAYKNPFAKGVGLLVFLMNSSLIFAFLMMLFNKLPLQIVLSILLLKAIADFLLIHRSAHFFGSKKLLWNFPWASCCYPFFTSYIAIASLFSGYNWKGRRFKK